MNQTKIIITLSIVCAILVVALMSYFLFQYFRPTEESAPSEKKEADRVDDPESTIYMSADGGETWRGISGARFPVTFITAERGRSRFLIGAADEGMWQLDAEEFDQVEELSESLRVFDADVRMRSQDAYLALETEGRGYVMKLVGTEFKELFFAPLESSPVRAVATDPFAADTIYAGAGTALYISEDDGDTWRTLHQFRKKIQDVHVHPHIAGWYLVTTESGDMFRSSDYGGSWEDISRGFSKFKDARKNQQVRVDPVTNTFYLTSDYGLLRSLDNAATWQEVPLLVPPDSLPILGFAVHPAKPHVLYVSAASQLYKSEDGGRTWSGSLFSEKGTIRVITFSPSPPYYLLLGFSPPSRF
ncbi:MAG: hypothetical protein G01um101470_431 [Parcubacteria group bacterium Gr01-1014_70]|nr:MAG: hypothetical protein G01um101470_431 [Parcubacteria group bacterium Gr01-1014_70]